MYKYKMDEQDTNTDFSFCKDIQQKAILLQGEGLD